MTQNKSSAWVQSQAEPWTLSFKAGVGLIADRPVGPLLGLPSNLRGGVTPHLAQIPPSTCPVGLHYHEPPFFLVWEHRRVLWPLACSYTRENGLVAGESFSAQKCVWFWTSLHALWGFLPHCRVHLSFSMTYTADGMSLPKLGLSSFLNAYLVLSHPVFHDNWQFPILWRWWWFVWDSICPLVNSLINSVGHQLWARNSPCLLALGHREGNGWGPCRQVLTPGRQTLEECDEHYQQGAAGQRGQQTPRGLAISEVPRTKRERMRRSNLVMGLHREGWGAFQTEGAARVRAWCRSKGGEKKDQRSFGRERECKGWGEARTPL